MHRFPSLKVSTLLKRMDRNGIEKAVLLPIENPEEVDYYLTTESVLKICQRHPDRLIPFCNVDPRRGIPGEFDPLPIIKEYSDRGCKGFGELLAGLPIDDQRTKKLFQVCQQLKLPVVLHFDSYINMDRPLLPAFESVVREFPDVTFVAHAMSWWGEISRQVQYDVLYPLKGAAGYPEGPVVSGGRVEYFLEKYDNVYADLSAYSAYNALTRDRDFGCRFLEKYSHKLLFATDYLYPRQPLPIIKFIKEVPISKSAFDRITRKNAVRLLQLSD